MIVRDAGTDALFAQRDRSEKQDRPIEDAIA
jgi:hypothetical protein